MKYSIRGNYIGTNTQIIPPDTVQGLNYDGTSHELNVCTGNTSLKPGRITKTGRGRAFVGSTRGSSRPSGRQAGVLAKDRNRNLAENRKKGVACTGGVYGGSTPSRQHNSRR